mgnify:FL=1
MFTSLKQMRLQHQILDTIYARGPISRIDIAHITGITPATVSILTGNMLTENYIEEIGEAAPKHQVGRKKVLLQIQSGHRYFIGCELGAEAFYFVLADQSGQIYAKSQHDFPTAFDAEENSPKVFVVALKSFLESHPEFPIMAIGIAIPGHYLKAKQRIASDHFHWMKFDLAPINRAFEIPIVYENNAHAMALTQRLLSSNQHDDNFIYLHVARGIFCSVGYHQRLYGRVNPLVGEIGHTVVNPEGELCECGRHGCLQTYASENTIIKKSQLLYRSAAHTFLRQLVTDEADISIDTVLQAYDLNDEGVRTLLDTAVKYLAAELNNLTLTIDAPRLILHGRLFDRPALFERLQQYLRENQFQFTSVTPKRLYVKPFTNFDSAMGGIGLAINARLLT